MLHPAGRLTLANWVPVMLGEPTSALARTYSAWVCVPVALRLKCRLVRSKTPEPLREMSSPTSLVMLSVIVPPAPVVPPAKVPPVMVILEWASEPPLSTRSVPLETVVPPV